MATTVRVYESEQAARDASAKLATAGFKQQRAFIASELSDQAEATVRAAIQDGLLGPGNATGCMENLQAGRSLVAVNAPFGSGKLAEHILATSGEGASFQLSYPIAGIPTPFSDALGLPVLSTFASMTGLVSSSWSLTPALLGGGAAPLSSIFRIPLLSTWKTGKKWSFGFPLISQNPALLSSLLALPTVLRPNPTWHFSFGFPILIRNPAPLSSLFSMPVLSGSARES